ncbi:MAG: ribosome small subunit-dependent GTPase A [Anaerovoracaceae bacterium]
MTDDKISANGIIVKALSGFYYVDTGTEVLECRARGKFKKNKFSPLVGDRVQISLAELTPVITEVFQRENVFDRPPVANIGQFVIVSALKDPEPNLFVMDKFLVNAEANNIPVLLCFNKVDLVESSVTENIKRIYGEIYPLIFTQATVSAEIKALLPYFKDRVSAFVGPSGVGKSTLINAIRQEHSAVTGNISEKNRRGRNTTRHVEIFTVDEGGMLFDTPGFTSFDVQDVEEADLGYMFPEFVPYIRNCRFNGCKHIKEPDCAVKSAVIEGGITRERYESYCSQIKEIRERKKNKY